MIDGYSTNSTPLVTTSDDFLRCPSCRSIDLIMDTTNMSHGIVQGVDGVLMEFTCKKCSSTPVLALFNDDIGLPQLNARINWVEKEVPRSEPTALDKLRSYSLTGQSKKLKKYVEENKLHDVELGDVVIPMLTPEK